MRQCFFKTTLVVVFAMVSMCAMAQRVVNGNHSGESHVSNKQAEFEAIKAEKEAYKIKVGKISETEFYRDSIVRKVAAGKVYEWKYRKTYAATSTNKISFSEKEEVLRGERTAVDPDHKDMDGNFRHKVQATVLGGANYVDNSVNPVVTGRLGYETCHFLFELEGSYSRAKYTSEASVEGYYNIFIANGNVGWKFWQDRRYRSYIAVLGTAGYAMQKTDSEDAEFYSKNYGFTFGGMVRGAWGFTDRLRLIGEVGYKVLPKVLHTGGTQEFDNHGPFANLGIGMTF